MEGTLSQCGKLGEMSDREAYPVPTRVKNKLVRLTVEGWSSVEAGVCQCTVTEQLVLEIIVKHDLLFYLLAD